MSSNTWDTALYESKHAFVWKYGEDLLNLLSPQPGEKILDLGCGTGQLTAKIAEAGAIALGIDADAAMIARANANYSNSDLNPDLDLNVNLNFAVADTGLRNWLLMFASRFLSELSPEQQNLVIHKVEQRLKSSLFRDGVWNADYRRIRIIGIR